MTTMTDITLPYPGKAAKVIEFLTGLFSSLCRKVGLYEHGFKAVDHVMLC